jgi:chondroitin AC lyase
MKTFFLIAAIGICQTACLAQNSGEHAFISNNFRFAGQQFTAMLQDIRKKDTLFPRTADSSGKPVLTNRYDWTSGFFPGSLWYTWEYTKDKTLRDAAEQWMNALAPVQYFSGHHDVGFMMYCSYGNAYRITGNTQYRDILVQTAKSLCKRYDHRIGSIKSWNTFVSGKTKTTYHFPVIIDNMMNLELLFFASRVTGDTMFRHIAVRHALTAMINHVRPDYSAYHVICYDSAGNVLARETAQGYADNSAWARGEAWGIYGFTMTYRETKDPRFLATACGMADFFLHHNNLPADKVPYWDFNVGQPGYTPHFNYPAAAFAATPRDASAAAIVASALFELSTYPCPHKKAYYNAAVAILHTLAGPAYRAKSATNAGFLLQHSVGNMPAHAEIDVPLVYADYYFLEALHRYNELATSGKLQTARP